MLLAAAFTTKDEIKAALVGLNKIQINLIKS